MLSVPTFRIFLREFSRLAPRRISAVKKLVAFYVDEHNKRLPHSAFRGQTPGEMYFGTGGSVPDELATAKAAARRSRVEVNRKASCPTCELEVALTS